MNRKNSIITEKDVLILRKLLEDGRASSSSISKEIDLGREIVNYRIKRLIKENLIVKFVPKINEEVLHYQEYIIFLKLNLDDEVSKEKFIRESVGNKYLIWIVKSQKGWDLIVRLYAESVDEFKLKLSEILEKFSDVLANYYTIISSEKVKESQREVLAREVFDEEYRRKSDFKMIKKGSIVQMDEKDREIINELESDARVQYMEIAKKLRISSDTVKYRIDRMRQHGILGKIIPVINFNKLGLNQYAAILRFQFLDSETEMKVISFLRSSKNIVRAIKSLSSEEYFLNIVTSGSTEIEELKKEILDLDERVDILEIFKVE